MNEKLTPAECLVIDAEFTPDRSNKHPREWLRREIIDLADELEGTGVCLKLGPSLRACGNWLIDEINERGLLSFADLKLFDTGNTLQRDGILLKEVEPDFLTVACAASVASMKALKAELPQTKILGVTVLTSFIKNDSLAVYRRAIQEAVSDLTGLAKEALIDGIVCAGTEASMIVDQYGPKILIVTPAIRPEGFMIPDDDQNQERTMTPTQAIKAGADMVVVGRAVTMAKNKKEAVLRIIDEITLAIES